MVKQEDLTAVLPDGTSFDLWERKCKYERTLYVACKCAWT